MYFFSQPEKNIGKMEEIRLIFAPEFKKTTNFRLYINTYATNEYLRRAKN